MTKVYPNHDRACYRLTLESLMSIKELAKVPDKVKQAVNSLCGNLELEKFAIFISLTHKSTSMGRYAFIHRYWTIKHIYEANWEALRQEYHKGYQAIPEVTDNHLLNPQEKEVIMAAVKTDVQTIISMIKNFRDVKSADRPLLPCPDREERVEIQTNGHKVGFETYYDKCRSTVCLSSGKYPTKTIPMDKVYLSDKLEDHHKPTVYCFNLDELLVLVTKSPDGPVINPQTGKVFDTATLSIFKSRFSKELAIYSYAMNYFREKVKPHY